MFFVRLNSSPVPRFAYAWSKDSPCGSTPSPPITGSFSIAKAAVPPAMKYGASLRAFLPNRNLTSSGISRKVASSAPVSSLPLAFR